ncbi:hypothetical protein BKA66DRAFT_564959 [Pyrenochaeta sp. MPI-SDFR-AT-0127]|nr:hypothetical protein BKA66DRAFT_564959 [Pyrenochaeta sp. MPI-SDFR-AT-0127]
MADQSAFQEQEARRLIDTIRIKHSTVGHEELAQIVTSLLYLTSSELYDNSTHCILELLQNADDNHYDDNVLPTLTFTSEPGGLRVDCNERGFQAKHVEAISTVRHSSKSGSKHSHSYTGEKGIGFKSVYRIADEVWISSRHYSFKFDKHQRFGMIAPVWAEFPKSVVPHLTSFFLKLAKEYDQAELIRELKTFEAQLLLFLRRVRKVVIKVLDENGSEWLQTIRKITTHEQNNKITILDIDGTQQRFATFEYHVSGLPLEPRRPDILSSPLSFAFPITNLPAEPQSGRQQVFALLPINDYGLAFLLNGNFVLSASRLNIDASLPWNQRLRDGLAEGFLAAVNHFNQGELKYFWPFYIPNNDISAFFSPARDLILSHLRENSVLESSGKSMAQPSTLMYILPSKYADSSGRPFTLCPDTANKYLSTRYPEWTIESILALGVSAMSDTEFLEDLELMINSSTTWFQAQTQEWHQELSKALLPLTQKNELKRILLRLPIIPLCDMIWTSAERNPVFFAKDLDPMKFSSSIDLSIIDPLVSQDYSRRTLLQALGIVEIDSTRLCRHIAEAHASNTFQAEKFSRAELISHAAYLFKSSWQPPDWIKVDLWFATSDGSRCKGSQTYIRGDCEADSAMARIFNKLRENFSTVHDNYFLAPASGDAVRLADHLDCPFATYKHATIGRVSGGLTRSLDGGALTENPLTVAILESGEAELIFDIDDEIFVADGRGGNSILLAESSTSQSHYSSSLPTGRIIHDDYFRQFDWLISPDLLQLSYEMRPKRSNLYTREARQSESNARKSWQQYMIKTLHLSDVPRLVARQKGTSKRKFWLSDEFKFLFKTCPVSDVLQLLNENWTTYADWLELSATQQKEDIAVNSNKALLAEIGDTMVKTNQGMLPLREMVLPNLDTYVKNLEIPVPLLEIKNSKDETLRRRLACFGIAVTNDLRYYLICMKALNRQGFPEQDTLSYLYEQIQSRYLNNEDEVHAAFDNNSLIYVGSSGSKSDKCSWLSIKEAMNRKTCVASLYPECKTLFQWLLSTSMNDMDALVSQAASINTSLSLLEISTLLTRLSATLSNTTPTKARVAVKPLRNRSIFPVCSYSQQNSYDGLVSIKDHNWFIADHPTFKQSFQGVVPLLAFTAFEVTSMESLLTSLGLDSRKLSKLCTKTVFPSGETQYSARDTRFFQKILSLFINDLIPQSRVDRNTICKQLENAFVIVAANIFERHVFRYKDGPEYLGNVRKGEVAMRVEPGGKDLRIFVARAGYIYRQRCFPLIGLIAEHCDINDSISLRLLDAALSDSRIDRVHKAFADAGYSGHNLQDYNVATATERRSRRGDIRRIPSIFSDEESTSDSDESAQRVANFGYRSAYEFDRSRRSRGRERNEIDRRLPLLSFGCADLELAENPIDAQGLYVMGQDMDPSRHLEYFGERLVSEMFKSKLADAYDPTLHWTSDLRLRAGVSPCSEDEDASPFTLADPKASNGISRLLSQLGHEKAVFWHAASPSYHVEIAISGVDRSAPFVWSTAQLKRIQKHQHPLGGQHVVRDVMILVKISNAYATPSFEIFTNPWDLVISDRFLMQGNAKFHATIKESGLCDRPFETRTSASILGETHHIPLAASVTLDRGTQLESLAATIRPNQSPYTYLPLDEGEIRLFLLFPGKQNDPIRGMIFTASSIEDAGPFRTLSYEWGIRKKEKQIFTESGILKVWSSLHSTITNLREDDSPTVLWIDAICINQNDDKEKTRQIRLLPEIFQHATRTLGFLGSDGRSNDAVQALLQIRAKLDTYNEWPKGLKAIPKSWEKDSKPRSDDPIWQEIKDFFDRTWFRRAWIVQEAVAAPTVTLVCGKWSVDWEDLHLAMEVVQQEPRLPADITASWAPFSALSSLRESEARQHRFSLLTLLTTFHYMDSTLKRDRFFALLGLASDGDEEEFAPTYGATSFATIACRYGRAFVKQGKGMHLLYRAGIAGRSDDGLVRFPSWLPDFTVKQSNRLLDLHHHGIVYNASKGFEEDIECRAWNMLRVRGCIVDEIVEVSKHSNGQGPKQWVKYFAEIDDMVDALYGDSQPEQSHNMKVQVPIAGALSLGEVSIEDSYAAFRHGLKKARFKSAKQLKLRQSEASTPSAFNVLQGRVMTPREKSKQYESLLKNNINGWRFIVTKRRHCGIAPSGIKAGDFVSILGGTVPFILRGSRMHREFRLIAGCYIHGIMNGEALAFKGVREEYIRID